MGLRSDKKGRRPDFKNKNPALTAKLNAGKGRPFLKLFCLGRLNANYCEAKRKSRMGTKQSKDAFNGEVRDERV